MKICMRMKGKNLANIRYALFREGTTWLYSIRLQTGETYRGSGNSRAAAKQQSEGIMKTLTSRNKLEDF